MKTSFHLLCEGFAHTLQHVKRTKNYTDFSTKLLIARLFVNAALSGDQFLNLHLFTFQMIYVLLHLLQNPVIIFSSKFPMFDILSMGKRSKTTLNTPILATP